MCVWLLFQTEKVPFDGLGLTFYVTSNRLLHLTTTLRSVSNSTRFIAFC